jgi:shikimate dehydrogenase
MELGLIGFPLSHSMSPEWFRKKFTQEGIVGSYTLFPLREIAEFPDLLHREPGLNGLNVTIPYKTAILPYLDNIDPAAGEIGAVNTVSILRKHGKIMTRGFNTDVSGFDAALPEMMPGIHALILGTGGASKAVAFVLQKRKIPFTFVSRTIGKNTTLGYSQLTKEHFEISRLIINTTPLGMFPLTKADPPIPYTHLTQDHILFDLIYNPLETRFLEEGRIRGCRTIHGMEMLHQQAEKAFEIFNSENY